MDSRWLLAQKYEKNWWDSKILNADLNFYFEFAEDVKKNLTPFLSINKNTKILEIGSGAAGILTFLKESDSRFAFDPLETFFYSFDKVKNFRDNKVIYLQAKGEFIPFKSNYFDLIIMDNVLDHCENTRAVIKESYRVLKNNGIIYFRNNTYNLWGKFVRSLMELFKIDKGHPHTFLKKDLVKEFKNLNYKILFYEHSGYFNTWKREFTKFTPKELMKSLLFVTRDKTLYILQKK